MEITPTGYARGRTPSRNNKARHLAQKDNPAAVAEAEERWKKLQAAKNLIELNFAQGVQP